MNLLELDIENIATINGFKFQRINKVGGLDCFIYKNKTRFAYLGMYFWKEGNKYNYRFGKFNAKQDASEMDCVIAFKNCEELVSEKMFATDNPKRFLNQLIEELHNK